MIKDDRAAMKRIDHIDILRGIGILYMLIGHIGFGPEMDIYLHAFHMPLFFFLSGYLFSFPDDLNLYVQKKVKSLLVPYFSFAFLYLALFVVVEEKINFKIMRSQCEGIFFFPTNRVPIAGALWFLMALFFSCIFFAMLYCISAKWKYHTEFMLMSTLGIMFLSMFSTSVVGVKLPWALAPAAVGLGLMGTGYFMRKYEESRIISAVLQMKWYLWLILFLASIFLVFYNGMINMRKGVYGNLPCAYVTAILCSLLYWNLAQKIEKYNFSGVLKLIGKNSLVFGCVNQIVIKMIKWKILKSFVYYEKFPISLISRVCVLAVTCLLCYVFVLIFENTKLKKMIGK